MEEINKRLTDINKRLTDIKLSLCWKAVSNFYQHIHSPSELDPECIPSQEHVIKYRELVIQELNPYMAYNLDEHTNNPLDAGHNDLQRLRNDLISILSDMLSLLEDIDDTVIDELRINYRGCSNGDYITNLIDSLNSTIENLNNDTLNFDAESFSNPENEGWCIIIDDTYGDCIQQSYDNRVKIAFGNVLSIIRNIEKITFL